MKAGSVSFEVVNQIDGSEMERTGGEPEVARSGGNSCCLVSTGLKSLPLLLVVFQDLEWVSMLFYLNCVYPRPLARLCKYFAVIITSQP